jgi:tetratricopeptide (TPR) repeat protein
LFDALTQFFLHLARARLIVLNIDDLQWADSTSLDYLNLLVLQLEPQSILLMGTYRSEEIESGESLLRAARDTQGRELVHHLSLSRLSLTEVDELLRQLTPVVPLPLSERLYAETEGNPFFLISVIQTLFEEGVLRLGPDRSWITEIDDITQNYSELLVPSRVKEVIERRVHRLEEEERGVLQLCSVLGQTVEYRVLERAWPGSRETLALRVEKLLARQLLRSRLGTGTQFEFGHDKIRQVVYSALSEPHRQELHGRVAQSLEAVHAAHLSDFYGVLAHHYSLDRAPEKALEYTLKTLDQAKQLYQNDEALRLVERGLELARQVAQTNSQAGRRLRFELLQRRADIGYLTGQLSQQEADIAELLQLGQELQDPNILAEAYWQRARLQMATGQYTQALESATQGYERLRLTPAAQAGESLWSKHLLNLGAIYFYRSEYPQALGHYEAALQYARAGADAQRQASALSAIGLIHARLSDYEPAFAHYEQALQLYRQVRNRAGECNTLTHLGNLYYRLGRPRQALEHYAKVLAISREIGDRRDQAAALLNQGNAEKQLGRYESAMQRYQEAYAIRRQLGDRRQQAGLLSNLAKVYRELGCLGEAERYYGEAQGIWQELEDRAGRAQILFEIAGLKTRQGQPERALELYQQASELNEELADAEGYAYCLLEMGQAYFERGQIEAAAEAADRALASAQQVSAIEVQIKSHSLRAQLALARGQAEPALTESSQAVELLTDETLLEDPHQIYLSHHRLLAATGHPAESKRYLEKAVRIVHERANQLRDEGLRASYLTKVPLNAEILRSWEAQQISEPDV